MGCAARWRLLLDGPAAGPWNMGVDEALLVRAQAAAAHTPHPGPVATLRLYRWQGPWLSLGYGQRLDEERREACEAAGVGVVQRATGGLAVLHGADLTYSVTAPADLLPPGLQGSYGLVADALCRAFARLGVALERLSRPARPQARGFDCFAVPAQDELLAGGRKLVGSAQRRAGGAVLQHGSIRLAPDPPTAACAAGLVARQATSLAELGVEPDGPALVEALVGGFSQVLGERPEAGALDSAERERAAQRGAGPARAS